MVNKSVGIHPTSSRGYDDIKVRASQPIRFVYMVNSHLIWVKADNPQTGILLFERQGTSREVATSAACARRPPWKPTSPARPGT